MSTNMMIRSMEGSSIGNIDNSDKNNNPLKLESGDLLYGEIISSNNKEVKVDIQTQNGNKEMLLQMQNASEKFESGDSIQIEVLESTKEKLKVSVKKIGEVQEENNKNHDPNKDKVNVESTKKVLLQNEQNKGQDISKQRNSALSEFRDQIKQLETSLSRSEYKALLQEGYDLTKMSVPMLNQFLQLHHEHAQEEFTPADVDKMNRFIEKVDKVKEMGAEDIVKFLLTNKPATISEIYKSLYSGGKQMPDYIIAESDYNSIKESVLQIVNNIPTTNSSELQSITKELVMRGGALDQRSLDVLTFLQQEHSADDIMKMASYQLEKGEALEEYSLSESQTVENIQSPIEIRETLEEIETITTQDLRRALSYNIPITLENLKRPLTDQDVHEKSMVLEKVVEKEKENLDILRYQMTFKAAIRLSLQGINIRTTPIEDLRVATEKLMGEHLSDEPVQSEETSDPVILQSPKEVWQSWQSSMAQINGASTQVITSAMGDNPVTLNTLVAKIKAGAERYDTLRTQIRPDLGDRIEKAFSNIGDILNDLGLEVTIYNERAVQILARNQMVLSVENIQQVKMIDLPLQELQKNMMPEHVYAFLKEGKDIMNTPLTVLTEEVMKRSESLVTNPVDRMIKELHQLLKTDEVPESIKNSVMGIYRLMNTISSGKNVAIGFLLDRNLPVTLENLFEASKYMQQTQRQKGKIDAAIDDTTGFLESVKQDRPSIIEQISSGYYEKNKELQAFIDKPESMVANTDSILEEINEQLQKLDYEKMQSILGKISTVHWSESQIAKDKLMNLTLNEFQALEQLQKDPFVFKELMNELVSLTTTDEKNKEWLEPLVENYMQNLEPSKRQRQAIYKTFDKIKEDFFEKALDQLGTQKKESGQSRSLSEVVNELEAHSRLEEKLSESNNYHTMPVMINNQLQQMSVYYYDQASGKSEAKSSPSIYMRFTTEHMGTANIRVQFLEQTEVTMFATEAQGNAKMKAYEEQITEVLQTLDLSIKEISYDFFDFPQPARVEAKDRTRNQQLKRYQESLFEKVI